MEFNEDAMASLTFKMTKEKQKKKIKNEIEIKRFEFRHLE